MCNGPVSALENATRLFVCAVWLPRSFTYGTRKAGVGVEAAEECVRWIKCTCSSANACISFVCASGDGSICGSERICVPIRLYCMRACWHSAH